MTSIPEKAMGDDTRTWFELREPGCVPERKGPIRPDGVASFLRELFKHRPQAYVTVITMGQDGPSLQDGPECLQMFDGRSMGTGRNHIASSSSAHASQAEPAPVVDDDMVERAREAWKACPGDNAVSMRAALTAALKPSEK